MSLIGIRNRIMLLGTLRDAGGRLVGGLALLQVIGNLGPAVTAAAVALLVSRVSAADGPAGLLSAVQVPLVIFGLALVAAHVMEAVTEPLTYLAISRINGRHRARIIRLTSRGSTVGGLESPEVQRLIYEAKADPDNWTQRTPGDGAVSQLNLIAAVIGLAGSCIVLARFAWWLIPLVAIPALVYRIMDRNRLVGWYEKWQENMDEGRRAEKWQAAVVSPSEGKDTRIFGFGNWVVDRLQLHIRRMYVPVWKAGERYILQQWSKFPLVAVPLAIAFGAVAYSAGQGLTSIAVATAVFSAGWGIYQVFAHNDARDPVGAIACLRAYAELERLLDAETEPAAPVEKAELPATGGPPMVRFENVSFTYPRTERRILDQIDLEIRPGELLGVVGLNGAGKTTLIKLLAGLYHPTGGRITVDGIDLARLDVTAWRTRLSIVFQDFIHYELSVADNVMLGHASAPRSQEALANAATSAGLGGVLDDLPARWDTPLSRSRTGGVDLSGGQWQQVALARALYGMQTGADILVLDEPTAHLDVRTEFGVFDRLIAERGDASVILISHRLSTVRRADRIVMLDGGRVAESGTHEELMAFGGAYARMFKIQAERFQQGYDDRIEEGELL
ncbi:ABC transporter ATP-binding protein [Micromonospora sp. FIMYZ51]|uniref:ABC transporter ATP-binding protein n=1 Tax=Micromonospora sp. FIMYZ51 TaxID=3051832 RepID=UPI00311DFB07